MTAALATTATPPPPIRVRPAPQAEPPYDEEFPGGSSRPVSTIGPHDTELPLDWGQPVRRQTNRQGQRQRASRPARRTAPRPGPAGWRAMTTDLPLAIKRFTDLYVEVLNERRPLNHLLAYASDPVFEVIREGLLSRGTSWWPRRRLEAVSPARTRHRPAVIRVRRLRSAQPVPGVAEVTAVLQRGDEVRAVALRLELDGSRWICTAFEFVG